RDIHQSPPLISDDAPCHDGPERQLPSRRGPPMNSSAHFLRHTMAFRTVAVVLTALALALGLTACGGSPQVEGTYTGSAGTTMLVLKDDGSALYSQQKRAGLETGAGTWSVDDGVLSV